MEEYKIICGSVSDCQKWLNQWRHQYELNIIAMCTEKSQVVILLTRKRIGGE